MPLFAPKLGLALAGGGARGGAHIGVLRVLNEIDYIPDVIAGTSIGGLVAVMRGAGWSLEQIEAFFTAHDFRAMMEIGREGTGLISNTPFRSELVRLFGDADLRDLSPRVAVVAADIRAFQRVLITRGSIVQALLATTALPGLFPPIEWGDYLLVDGGVVENVPTQAAYQMGAERVVAVDIGEGVRTAGLAPDGGDSLGDHIQRMLYWLLSLANRQQAFDTLVTSSMISANLLVQYHLALFPPDVLVRPVMPDIGAFATDRIVDAIEAGEAAAREKQSDILRAMQFRPWRPERQAFIPDLIEI